MFLSHLKYAKQLTCEKYTCEISCKEIYLQKKNKQVKLVCAQFYFLFKKTTSNINYNTELKNNYISDKYKKVYLQN